MEVVASSVNASLSLHCCQNSPILAISNPQVSPWKCFSLRVIESRYSLTHMRKKDVVFTNRGYGNEFSVGMVSRVSSICFQCSLFPSRWGFLGKRRKSKSLLRIKDWSVSLRQHASVQFVRLVAGVMLVMAVSLNSSKAAWALSEENLLFLEAWRTIDRAYIDKSFNGQSWFRYREDALRNEPMNNREETYMAIKKMLATLDDPFTRFLEPEKFRSLRSGTRGALTGVGLSIGYPTKVDMPTSGLIVISASPGGPAYRAGVLSGDFILAIDDTSTENMGLYDAAERLQGPEGSTVSLTIRSGSDVKHLALTREKVSLNPVKSRLCKLPASGNDFPTVGYIKLTTFNQNASRAVKEAMNTLRSENVNAFILDLRDNSGGLFPEGIEIAKIWLDKGVIVYICDSRGVRDILDTDGSSALATSEPLAVLAACEVVMNFGAAGLESTMDSYPVIPIGTMQHLELYHLQNASAFLTKLPCIRLLIPQLLKCWKVNKGTASASEILAGALKDNKRAILFGEPTFGKGKIQSVFELSDGSGLVVTVARYETPAHTDIDKVGVIPDHPLPTSFPKDEDAFCTCLQDPASSCHVNRVQLFPR